MGELRVFISSTFRDLQEERDYLVRKIFPEIRSLCRDRGVTFTDVDLRWGITEEEAERGGIIRICLDEIDRCRPYFLGILGQRYGWTPSRDDAAILADDFPEIAAAINDGSSITEMEIVHGVLANPAMSGHAAFYFRDRTVTPDEFIDKDVAAIAKLRDLKDRIRHSGFPVRENFRSPADLGSLITKDLRAVIDAVFPLSEAPGPLEEERRAHTAFALSRRLGYVANPDYQKKFDEWLAPPDGMLQPEEKTAGGTPLVIRGETGMGKSSLLACLAEEYRAARPTALVVEHYVGASRSSGSATSVMRHIVEEICERFSIADEIPAKPELLERSFSNWLFRAEHLAKESGIDVLIVVDAVNQLDEAGRRLAWLPETIPAGIRLLVSTAPGDCADRLAPRFWSTLEVVPIDTPETRRQIVERYLGGFRKTISSRQMERLTGDSKASSPLFLRVVAEELRLHAEYQTLDVVIERYSQAVDLPDVFDRMLDRLEGDYSREAVQGTLQLIAASRSGLSEADLLELTGLSRMDFSRMLFALDYHLIRHDGLLGFFHNYLRSAVERRYLADRETERGSHMQIAAYCQKVVTASMESGSDVPHGMARELAYQIHAAGETDRLAACLSTMPVFLSLYQGRTEEEVLGYWSSMVEHENVEERFRHGVERWGAKDAKTRSAGLGRVANLLERLGRWDGAMTLQRERLASAVEHNNRREEAGARLRLGALMNMRGDHAGALEELGRSLELFTKLRDRGGVGRAHGIRGIVYYGRGEYHRALTSYAKQLRICERMGDRLGAASIHGNMGNVLYSRGEYQQALASCQASLRIYDELGYRAGIATVQGNIGAVYTEQGEYDRALASFEVNARLSDELGDRDGVARARGNMGRIYLARGEYDRALACYQDSLRICEEIGDRKGAAYAHGDIGLAYSSQGEYDRALSSHEAQLRISRDLGDRLGIASAYGSMGIVYANRGEYDRALASFELWLRTSQEFGDRSSVANAQGNMGIVSSHRGDYDKALEHFDLALRESRAIGDRYALANWLAGRAGLLLDLRAEATPPLWLVSLLPRATPASWTAIALQTARDDAEECLTLGRDLDLPDILFSTHVLLARISAVEVGASAALQRLAELLENAGEDRQRAELHYWMWQLGRARVAPETTATGRPVESDAGMVESDDHRRKALSLYNALFAKTPNHEYAKRIDELRSREAGRLGGA